MHLPTEVAPATDAAAEAADLGAEDPEEAGDDSEAADQEPGSAMKCAYCNHPIVDGELLQMIGGRLYHADLCTKYAKPIAIAAE